MAQTPPQIPVIVARGRTSGLAPFPQGRKVHGDRGGCAKVASLSRPELEEALLLLRKAREDVGAVEKLFADADVADAVVGFHAQQTAAGILRVPAPSKPSFPADRSMVSVILRGTDLGGHDEGSDLGLGGVCTPPTSLPFLASPAH